MPEFDGGVILPDPFETILGGRRYWQFANGRILPVIAGGAPEGEGGDGGGDGSGAGDGASPDGDTSDGDGSSGGGEDEKDPRVKEARAEAISERQRRQKLETDLREASERLKAIEDKDKSELERAQGEATTASERVVVLEQQNRSLHMQLAFSEAGRAAGAIRPEKLWRHADDSGVEVETDDEGRVTNAKAVVDKIKSSMPELFDEKSKPKGDADQGPRTKGKPTGDAQPGSDRLRRAYATD